MYISVIIASVGRPQILCQTLASLSIQTRLPDEIIVVVSSSDDISDKLASDPKYRILFSERGSTVQRNKGLENTHPLSDIVVFLDDDVVLAENYLTKVENYMELNLDVVGFSGVPVLNRPQNGLMPHSLAQDILKEQSVYSFVDKEQRGLYGCNMVSRTNVAKQEKFDENLVLYALLEDRDFGIRLRKYGRVTEYSGARMIHLGTPGGRVSQRQQGYAQIMNPAYLFIKGQGYNMSDIYLGPVKSLLANISGVIGLAKKLTPNDPSYYNRGERLHGNLLAIKDILRGRIDPQRIRHVEK